MTGFAALRGHVGTDTYAYHMMFIENADEDLRHLFSLVEPIFALLIGFIGKLTSNAFVFIVAVAIIQGLLLVKLTRTSKSPAEFLLLYTSIFYLNFHFNILRAGTSVLFLILAARALQDARDQRLFYVWGISAVLSHYSATVAFIPMLLFNNRSDRTERFAAALLLVACGVVFLYMFSSDGLLNKYSIYSDLLTPDVTQTGSRSFYVGLPIYLTLYLSVVRKEGFFKLTILFLIWMILRWLTSMFSLVGRLEIIANALFLFYVVEIHLNGRRKQLRRIAIALLAAMWTYGGIVGLAAEETIMANLGVIGDLYLASPFVPYRFLWDVQ